MTIVAAFDVDKTLTRRDCVTAFAEEVIGRNRLAIGLLRRAPSAMRRIGDRNALKELVTEIVFRGRDRSAIDELGADFAERVHANWMRPDTWARLDWHREQQHRVVLVSASYEIYLVPLARLLGVDTALGTRLESRGGILTGALEGANCRGPEKVRRLREWMERNGVDRAAVELWAYGDSTGDRALLAASDHAVWVKSTITRVPRGSHDGRNRVADHGR